MLSTHRNMKSNDRTRSTPKRRRKAPDTIQSATLVEQTQTGVLGDFMDTDKLAVELDVAPLTLVRWRLQKTGPPVTRLGPRILYRRSSVQAWLAEQERKWA